ncbi:hypothetical protein ACFFSW_19915 [Saccharothrix longispora]|uniref:Oligomerization/nucleic acid binding protein n=1 Tax=Saccharothrix longispora TaxID=33920 RepID=A0ABU1Q4V6_9PSEU|nr:hypothetical protein [Saccharothrix longispora]MDR6597459.1 hypothetical protein [Saccharothrix longispora]
MSWQEDLAELDRTLAEGRISADEYRRRRDELLASATSSGTPPGGTPAQQQPDSGPFAPPVRWDAVPPNPRQPNPQQPNPDATQVVNNQANPDKTQVVSGQQRGQDAERTQYVTPIAPPPNRMPQQNWQSGPPVSTPPWGSDSFGGDQPSWIAQGPEVFDEKPGGGKRVIAIVGAVLVLALIGGGVWWFTTQSGSTDDNGQTGGTSSTSSPAPTTTTTKPKDDLSITELPGKVENHEAVTTFANSPQANFLTPEEIAFYTTAGAGKARLAASRNDDGVHVLVFTVQAETPAQADTARDALAEQQLTYGMEEYADSPTGVRSGQVEKGSATPATIRGHYSAKSTIVRIQVNGDDLKKVAEVYDEITAQQLEVLAANG